MSFSIKKFAAGSKALIILFRIYDNWRQKRRFKSGNTVTQYGSTHSALTLTESLNYIDQVFDEYLTYSDLSPEMLRGKRVLEVGPGDNFGVALRFIVAGAAQVTSLDKFYSERNVGQQSKIYQALRQRLSREEMRDFDDAIQLEDGIQLNSERLKYIHGYGIEEAAQILKAESFDLIVSRAVIHNVYDIDAGIQAMDKLLVPGGYMAHKIDLSDENMFSSRGMHPLTFLTISESVYRRMAADSGKPNRRLINYYRETMADLGYKTRIFISAIVGAGRLIPYKESIHLGTDYSESTVTLINEIRPKLSPPYRNLSDGDLAAAGILLAAQKPSSQN